MTIEQRVIQAAYGKPNELARVILPLVFKNPNNINRIKLIAYKRYGLSSNLVTETIKELMNYETSTIIYNSTK